MTYKNRNQVIVIITAILILLSDGYFHLVIAQSGKESQNQIPNSEPFLVMQVSPSNASHNVMPDMVVSVTFNRAVDFTTIDSETFIVRGSLTGNYPGIYTQHNNTIQFNPSQNFKVGEDIVVNLSNEIYAEDGIPLKAYAWQFSIAVDDGTGKFTDSGETFSDSINSPGVALGDLDNDGDLDAFAVTHDFSKVYFNTGNGHFVDSGQSITNTWGWRIALGDLDNDGDLDAYIGDHATGHMVWMNNGLGYFTNSGQKLGNGQTYGLALGDLDGDGDVDVVAANYNGNAIWLNNGLGFFTKSNQNLGEYGVDVAMGDIDADGDLDLFFVNDIYNTDGLPATVWINNGSGIFYDSGQRLGYSQGVSVTLADYDSDGDLDAFAANEDYQPDKVWLNNGDGVFTDSGQNLGSGYSLDIATGDFDNDGDLDVFVATGYKTGQPPDTNKIWLNNGAGSFSQATDGFSPAFCGTISVGDVDKDGDLDTLLGYGNNQPVKLWLNSNYVGRVYLPLTIK